MTPAAASTSAEGRPGPATVLLVGPEAEALAPRLELSGHRAIALRDPDPEPTPAPAAVIVSPDLESRVASLRRRFPRVPVLLGIRSDGVEGRIRCLASGADDLWLTSVGASDLLTRLRIHLGLREDQPPLLEPVALEEVIRVDDLVVAPASRRVQRAGRIVPLTGREYELLLLLVRERQGVVSRERILAEIWPGEKPSSSNVIEVYVRYLRRKLEQGGQRRLIHTVRGEGYRLGARPAPAAGQGSNPLPSPPQP